MSDLRKICHELYHDREFALRFQGVGDADTLLRYFTSRGVSYVDALALAQAYVAGCIHSAIQMERINQRAEVKG